MLALRPVVEWLNVTTPRQGCKPDCEPVRLCLYKMATGMNSWPLASAVNVGKAGFAVRIRQGAITFWDKCSFTSIAINDRFIFIAYETAPCRPQRLSGKVGAGLGGLDITANHSQISTPAVTGDQRERTQSDLSTSKVACATGLDLCAQRIAETHAASGIT